MRRRDPGSRGARRIGYPVGMPLYEYQCTDCHTHFELLVREQTTLECPTCHGTHLEKQLSVFAVGGDSPRRSAQPAVGPCGACGHPDGPGSCSVN